MGVVLKKVLKVKKVIKKKARKIIKLKVQSKLVRNPKIVVKHSKKVVKRAIKKIKVIKVTIKKIRIEVINIRKVIRIMKDKIVKMKVSAEAAEIPQQKIKIKKMIVKL